MFRNLKRLAVSTLTVALCTPLAQAAEPSAEQALELAPVQKDVAYQKPSKDEAAKCTVESVKDKNGSGWIVRDPSGLVLRRFLDTNSDNKLDLWCYYRDGVEIYRDVDGNFNGKADEYRWLGTGGTRWAVDSNEDGKPDEWKRISPEEVTAEVVGALRDRDATRFGRLLLTSEEAGELGLGESQTAELRQKIEGAKSGFAEFARRQKLVTDKSVWTNFGATQPGVFPSGSNGSTKDVVAYENVAAVIETDGKHAQLPIGTIVQAGGTWRLIDLPTLPGDEKVAAAPTGYFFTAAATPAARPQAAEVDPEFQKLADSLTELERKLAKAVRPEEIAALSEKKSEIVKQLYETAPNETERENWLHQLADTLSAAALAGGGEEAVDRLAALADNLVEKKARPAEIAYVRFRHITAEYTRDVQDSSIAFAKTQARWVERLEAFVNEFPQADDAPEALLQLAVARESEDSPDTLKWYRQILRDFPKSDVAKKAAGAIRRIESVGQPLGLSGRTLEGKSLDLAAFRGQVVVVHYWSTSCEPCKEDMQRLKELQQGKYAKQKLALLGVNLDAQAPAAQAYLRAAKIGWPQLHDPSGPDGKLATDLGVFTLPMMLLIDKDGRLVRGNLHVGELDSELAKLFRERATSSKPTTSNSPRK